jgi:hypothetical protein
MQIKMLISLFSSIIFVNGTWYIFLVRRWIQRRFKAVTAPVNSLEAFLIRVVWQGGRESTGGSDLTMH